MQNKMTIRISFIIVLALIAYAFWASPVMAASANRKLVESVEIQRYNKSTEKWETTGMHTYTYNKKGDPVKHEYTSYTNADRYTETFSYTYRKNGKHKKTAYERTGRFFAGFFSGGDYCNYTDKGHIYYNKKGRRTKIKYKSHYKYENSATSWNEKYSYKYKYTRGGCYYNKENAKDDRCKYKAKARKGGILKNVLRKHNYEKKWKKYFKFNKRGLFRSCKDLYNTKSCKYSYYKETGLVKTAKSGSVRYVFKYTTKSMGKIRYTAMINHFTAWGSDYEDDVLFFWY